MASPFPDNDERDHQRHRDQDESFIAAERKPGTGIIAIADTTDVKMGT
jgi:hypothetical protein